MARNENPPIGRGDTMFGSGTTDTTSFANLLGKTWVFEDIDLSTGVGAKVARSGRDVVCRLVRNTSGITLLPKRTVSHAAGSLGNVDGYTTTTAAPVSGVVDEWLPSTGVVANDVFWVVVEGPTMCITDLAGAAANLLPADTILVALTAATSQCTTAGRIAPQDVTGATTALANNVQNALGRAISAATTTQTNSSLLINMYARKW